MSDTNGTPDGGDGGAAASPPADQSPVAPSPQDAAPPAPPPDTSQSASITDTSQADPSQGTSQPDPPQDTSLLDPSQDSSKAGDGSGNTCKAGDAQHDWVHDTLGIDPRSCNPDQADAASPNDADGGAPPPVGQDAGNTQAGPADAGVPSGAPDGNTAHDAQDGGAGNGGAGGAGSGVRDTGAEGADPVPDRSPQNPTQAQPQEEGFVDKVKDFFGVGPEADRKAVVDDAVDKVRLKNDDQIAAMTPEEKARLVQDITSNGDPKGFDRGIQKRIYENTPTDPEYLKKQDAQSDEVAKQLAADPDMKKAQANWPTMTDDEKAATLKKVVEAQSKAMGIPAPEIVVDNGMKEAGQTVDGVYKDDGKLHVNMDKDAMSSTLPGALSIAAHENTHHYQQDLVNRLNNGQLKEGDPEYAQAKMFAVNNAPHGYIDPAEGLNSYKQQPVERDAWNNGARTSRKILNGLGGQP